jgi:hypothetical protein
MVCGIHKRCVDYHPRPSSSRASKVQFHRDTAILNYHGVAAVAFYAVEMSHHHPTMMTPLPEGMSPDVVDVGDGVLVLSMSSSTMSFARTSW